MSFSSSHSIAFTKWLISKIPASPGLGTSNNIGPALWDEFLLTNEFARVPNNTVGTKPASERVENSNEIITFKCNHFQVIHRTPPSSSPTFFPIPTEVNMQPIINKGTGAGGANTNYHGKMFENKTNNQQRLLEMGYSKNVENITKTTKASSKTYDYSLSKTLEDKKITFVLQNGLKTYMKKNHNTDLFRCPDEAYIIEYANSDRKVIKILEKKRAKCRRFCRNEIMVRSVSQTGV
jgi:hypothetical protein